MKLNVVKATDFYVVPRYWKTAFKGYSKTDPDVRIHNVSVFGWWALLIVELT